MCGYSQWAPLIKELRAKQVNDAVRSRFLVEDHYGIVWTGSDKGLTKFSSDNRYESISFPQKITCALSVDSSLWIGMDDGKLHIFNTASLALSRTIQISDSSAISAIYRKENQLVLSTLGEGVYLLEGNSKTHFSTVNALSNNHIYDALLIKDQLIAVSDQGIDVVEIHSKKRLQHLPSSITTSVVYSDSVILATSHRYGLVKLDLNKSDQPPPAKTPGQPSFNKIKTYLDRIFALGEKGIYEIDSLIPSIIINNNNILDFIVLDEGIMLVLLENGGVLMADMRFSKSMTKTFSNNTALTQNTNQIFTAGEGRIQIRNSSTGETVNDITLQGKPVIVSLAATDNDLFIGTFNGGIYKYNLTNTEINKIDTTNGLPDNNVLSMSLRNDTLWFVTLSGLSCLSPKGHVSHYSTPEEATYIYSVFTNDTSIVIGTDGDGIYELAQNSFTPVPYADRLKNETVYDISKDGSGNLWFITKNQNLLRYDPALNRFSSMNLESDGYIMASGGFGNTALAVGNEWLKYYGNGRIITIENNLLFEKLSGEYLNNISFDGDKRILFTSGNELYSFSTEHLGSYPKVVLESFKANLIESTLSANNLESKINHISYTFKPVWYQNQENVRFRYRLTGVDSDWNYSSVNSAVYPNLKYGTYTFEVETGLGSEYFSDSRVQHTFAIAKPFYLEWWFIVTVLLLTILGIYGLSKWQLAGVNRKWQSEKKLVESELAVLRNQVNPHFLFNSFNTLMNLIETEPKAAEEYLQRLSHFYRKILENQDNQVLLLCKEIENLEEYIYLQKQRFGEAITLNNQLDKKLSGTRIPALTLQLLAENAIKHNVVSQSNPLTIQISNTEEYIFFTNVRMPLSQSATGTHTGLENIQTRYKVLFKKEIRIISSATEFTIKLPIIAEWGY